MQYYLFGSYMRICFLLFTSALITAVNKGQGQTTPIADHLFRADTLVSLSGQNVEMWRDIQNEGVAFNQTNAANQPILGTSSEFEALEFMGGNKFLSLNTNVSPQTAVILIQIDQFPSYARIIDANEANESGIHIKPAGIEFRFDDTSSKRTLVSFSSNGISMISVVTSSEDDPAFVRLNGNQTLIDSDHNWVSGSYQIGRSSLSFTGKVLEISLFAEVLSEAQVELYENSRYSHYSPPPSLASSDTLFTQDFCPVELEAGERFESFLWQDGSTNQTFIAESPGWYSVEVEDIFGRILSDSVYIAFPGNYLDSLSLCLESEFNYDTGLNQDEFSFNWSPAGNGSSITINEAGTYSVEITGPFGCSFSPPPLEVEIDSFPSLLAIQVEVPFCEGNILNVNLAEETTGYLWNDLISTPTFEPTESGTYWVEASNINGCSAQDTVNVEIAGTSPSVEFSFDTPCQKSLVEFSNTTSPEEGFIIDEEWIINEQIYTGANPEVIFYELGSYQVTLNVTLSTGCKGESSGVIDVLPSPIAGFNTPIICEGSEFTFQNLSFIEPPNNIDSYSWDFGDNSVSSEENPTKSYDNAGEYQVILNVLGSNECSAEIQSLLTVNSDDVSNPFFSASCRGLIHQFRSDSLISTTEEGIEFWHDVITSSLYFNQNSAVDRPQYITDETPFPVLRFASDGSFLQINQAIQPQTIAALIRIPTFPSYARLIDANDGNDSGIHLNANGFQARFDDDGTKRVEFGGSFSGFQFVTVSSSLGEIDALARANNSGFILGQDRNFVVGEYQISSPSFGFSGDLVEISIFDSELTDAELAHFENERADSYIAPLDIHESDTIKVDNLCGTSIDAGERFESYLWSTNESSAVITTDAEGWYVVEVVDLFNRTFIDSVFVDYPGDYLDSFTLCSQETAIYDLNLDEDFYDFEWSTTETSPSIEISEEGTYSVLVTDTLGCSYMSPEIFVGVDSFPITTEIIDIPTFCLGNDLFLSSGFEEAETYLWSTDEETAFIQPQESGEYWVEAINSNGCVGRDTVVIDIVGVAPLAEFEFSPPCENNDVIFTDVTIPIAGATVIEWDWTFENNLSGSSDEENPSIFYPAVGEFPVVLTVTLDDGCTGTVRDTIFVNPLPDVNFSAPLVCAGNEVFFESFSAVPNGGIIALQLWSFGNGTEDQGAIGSTIFEETGGNTVMHIVTTEAACTDSLSRTVEVLGSPIADFNIEDICIDQTASFNENVDTSVSGPVFYNWQFGDGFFSNFPNTSHDYAEAGLYEVTLTATGNNVGASGCVDQMTKQIRVYNPPSPQLLHKDQCLGEMSNLVDLTSPNAIEGEVDGIFQRIWTLIDGPTGNQEGFIGNDSLQSFFAESSGTYEIDLQIETEAGCSSSSSGSFLVEAIPRSDFELILPDLDPPFLATPINLSEDGVSYKWFLNGVFLSEEFEPTITFSDTINYEVMLVSTNLIDCNDTAKSNFTVVSPFYDLALVDLEFQTQGGRLVLNAFIGNNGNVAVTSFDSDIQVGRDVKFSINSETEILPGQIIDYPLGSEIGYLPGRDLPYTCLKISNPNDQIEIDTTNNILCIGLNEQKAIFDAPYPNPAEDEVKLTVILPEPGEVNLEITSSDGKELVKTSFTLDKGPSIIDYPLIGWSEGLYFFKFSYKSQEEIHRLIIGR